MRRPYRAYLWRQVLAVGAGAAALASFNLIVDPYRAYRLFVSPELERFKNTAVTRRTKAEMMRHGDWDLVFLGSSRTEAGFDAEHPALGGRRAFNLGLSGTSLPEVEGALRYALAQGSVRTVLLLAEFELFRDDASLGDDFRHSPFHDEYGRLEYHGSNLFGMQATEHSLRTLADYAAGRVAIHDRYGRMVFPLRGFETGHAALFRRALLGHGSLYAFRYAPPEVERFEDMVDACLAGGVDVVVAIAPAHALALVTYERQGLWPAWEGWKRAIAAAVERRNRAHPDRGPARLLDFAGFSPYACEPVPRDPSGSMRWYWDPTHFKKELGDVLLERMFGGAPADGDFGAPLRPDSVDALLARQNDERIRYAAAHGEDVRLLDPPAP